MLVDDGDEDIVKASRPRPSHGRAGMGRGSGDPSGLEKSMQMSMYPDDDDDDDDDDDVGFIVSHVNPRKAEYIIECLNRGSRWIP